MDQLQMLINVFHSIKKQEFNGGLLKYKNLKCKDFNNFAFKDSYSKLINVN